MNKYILRLKRLEKIKEGEERIVNKIRKKVLM